MTGHAAVTSGPTSGLLHCSATNVVPHEASSSGGHAVLVATTGVFTGSVAAAVVAAAVAVAMVGRFHAALQQQENFSAVFDVSGISDVV